MVRCRFDVVLRLQDILDGFLMSNRIDIQTYLDECEKILVDTGWTWPEYAREIDRRWDYLFGLPITPGLN